MIESSGTGASLWGEKLGFAAAKAIFEKSIELGINTFDLAENYGKGKTQEFLGKMLEESELERDSIVLIDKGIFVQRLS